MIMSKTKNWIMDMEEQYYDIASKIITQCEDFGEFVLEMGEHYNLISPTYDEYEIDDILNEMWTEQQSKYL